MKTRRHPFVYILLLCTALLFNVNESFSQQFNPKDSEDMDIEINVNDQLRYDPTKDLNEQIKETSEFVDSVLRAIDHNLITKMLESATMVVNGNEQMMINLLSAEEIESIKEAESSLDISKAKAQLKAIQQEFTALSKQKSKTKKEELYIAILDKFQTTDFYKITAEVFMPILTKYLIQSLQQVTSSLISTEASPSLTEDTPQTFVTSVLAYHNFKVSDIPCGSLTGLKLLSIEAKKDETLVTFAFPVVNTNAIRIRDTYALIDEISGDQYMVRGGLPLNVDADLQPYNGKTVEYTLSFPPLKKGVKKISIKSVDNLNPKSTLYITDINLKEYLNRKHPNVITQYKEDYQDRGFKINPYLSYNPSAWYQLISVDRRRDETRVTIGVSVHSDVQTHTFTRNLFIVDRKTDDVYRNYLVEGGYEFGKIYEIRGHKGQVVEFTILFPPLKSSVKEVDICGVRNNPSLNTLNFMNIKLNDYKPQKGRNAVWATPATVVSNPTLNQPPIYYQTRVSTPKVEKVPYAVEFQALIDEIDHTHESAKKAQIARRAVTFNRLIAGQIEDLLISLSDETQAKQKLAIELYAMCSDKENYVDILNLFPTDKERLPIARSMLQYNTKNRSLKEKQELMTDQEFEWHYDLLLLFSSEDDRLSLLSLAREVGMLSAEQVNDLIITFSKDKQIKVFTMLASRCPDKDGLVEVSNTFFYAPADREAALKAIVF